MLDDKWLDAIEDTIRNYNDKYNNGFDPMHLAMYLNPKLPKYAELREYIGYLELKKRVELRSGRLWALGEARKSERGMSEE